MILSLILYPIYLVVGLIVAATIYKAVTQPKIQQKGNATVVSYGDKVPSPLDLYLRIIFSVYNFQKPGFLPSGKKIPRFEAEANTANAPEEKINQYMQITGFDTKSKNVPITFPFASSLPLMSCIITHPKFPMKPLTPYVHLTQTCELLRPIAKTEVYGKRGVLEGGENSDRGTEMSGVTEIYSKDKQLIGRGVSGFLVVRRSKKSEPKVEKEPELPAVTKTTTFKVPENAGRKYANASGDFNPWHLNGTLAQLFGFKKALAHGFWTASRCVAEIGDAMPAYPLRMEVEWKRPCFLPSTVTCSIRATPKKVYFELHSEDKQHLHLTGFVENIPDMKLQPL